MKVLLVSTFEGGYQPISLATAHSALKKHEIETVILDTFVEGINEIKLKDADIVAISLPLFDSVQPGLELSKLVKELNPDAHITFFGQHSTIHSKRLVGRYGDTCIVGEWEKPIVEIAESLQKDHYDLSTIPGVVTEMHVQTNNIPHPLMSRDHFNVPARENLPPLDKYPQKQIEKLIGSPQVVGSTEIARGCHHKCSYCSVFAAYDGKVILVPEDVIFQDVKNLVDMGMTHLTFIDADFFNAKKHGVNMIRKLHETFPFLTYDFTTRVDHILENQEVIKEMSEMGVKFITSALEFPLQKVLDQVVKAFKVEEIDKAISFIKTTGIQLNPTFIMYNPWIDLEDFVAFDEFVQRNELENIIDPIQYETRLYLYKGSPLLNNPTIQELDLEEHEFHFEWKHRDPRVDELFLDNLTPAEEGIFKRCCLKC
ncbi:arsinothricin biosynthesis radical SAM protein ArsL [Bacillus alkalicellulosilyticus]|uniref:arsinothricin biosynthesis radical SAM protein ArsL n=1 Tax=Alkalihalobacterium alkalicellulosilyticum TaxID=1912214 RepID=UPI000996AB75|nr:RCCLKC-tail radical SAM protein [Bacillus alkalicellulosilyticus]